MNLKKKYGNYELHPQMKITGYENEIWDEKKEIIEELKRAVQEKQKEKKTCILSHISFLNSFRFFSFS